ncbi:MAG: hypothetical protein AB7V46_10255, partial [Thermomicrobiales bacterium]
HRANYVFSVWASDQVFQLNCRPIAIAVLALADLPHALWTSVASSGECIWTVRPFRFTCGYSTPRGSAGTRWSAGGGYETRSPAPWSLYTII